MNVRLSHTSQRFLPHSQADEIWVLSPTSLSLPLSSVRDSDFHIHIIYGGKICEGMEQGLFSGGAILMVVLGETTGIILCAFK